MPPSKRRPKQRATLRRTETAPAPATPRARSKAPTPTKRKVGNESPAPATPKVGSRAPPPATQTVGQAGPSKSGDVEGPVPPEVAAPRTLPFHTVGLGASAGGLEALEAFFEALPAEPGTAFVVVTHQPAGHVSLLPELLARHTKLPVALVRDGVQVELNHVYVSPPGRYVAMLGGKLETMEPPHGTLVQLPIDYFFRSLASDQQDRAVCVVLSGTGTDGTLGMRAIKGEGGMAMIQDETSAQYSGMPLSASGTGLADYVLPPGRMPAQLAAYARSPGSEEPQEVEARLNDALRKIFVLLRNQTGHDFSGYKAKTIRRRIERRMRVHLLDQPAEYVRLLQANPHELDLLFQELLIGVTSFFRDREAFEALEAALHKRVTDKPDAASLRIWVAGCSSGEEAYSITILAAEIATRSRRPLTIQVFATDLDARAIEIARTGVYPMGAAADIGPARLERFFSLEDGHIRVKKEIRDRVVFAVQNVVKDPPFTRLDVVSCRNLLIYLDTDLQKRLIPLFHYSLDPGGLLLLGTSETTGPFDRLFEPIDRKWRLYERRPTRRGATPIAFPVLPSRRELARAAPSGAPGSTRLAESVQKLLLERFVPPTVITNDKGDIAYVHGRAGPYLEPSAGEPRNNVFTMAREGLSHELRPALRQAAREDREIERPGVRVHTDEGGIRAVTLIVKRLTDPEAVRDLLRVSFEPTRSVSASPAPSTGRARRGSRGGTRVAELEGELRHTKDILRSAVGDLETSNQDLKSANEELQSMNEELQSANEELETSKEELQSLNEELQTVNGEFQAKMEEVSRANDDMRNLLNGTSIATLFLDRDLKIKRFTDQTREVISLIPADIGRPVSDLVSHLRYDTLSDDARRVLDTLTPHEVEVQTRGGHWRLLRMLPYRTGQNVIDGVVVTFVDIDRVKRAELLAASRSLAQSIVQTVREPLLVLDEGLHVVTANRALFRVLGLKEEDVTGRSLFDIGGTFFAAPRLRELLGDVVARGSAFQDLELEHELPGVGVRRILMNARRLETESAPLGHVLLALEDTTGRPLSP